ncbi:MAG: RNase adapter RapZ [Pseudomonadota bacterium]
MKDGVTGFSESRRDGQPLRQPAPLVLVVAGMSGAGRSTAMAALEDLGYEAINNFPLNLCEALIEPVAGTAAPIAVGIETRSRGFSSRAMIDTVDALRNRWRAGTILVFLDCDEEKLLARFNQTRRRHPLAPAEDAATGIQRERNILADVRDHADAVIDTTPMTPHELKAELEARFALDRSTGLSVTIQSFSYKRGVPVSADMVFDCRFLRNPYWDETLRDLDGRSEGIQDFVRGDPLYGAFFGKLCDMLELLLPAYRAEGKVYLTVALGCTGGMHRSVTVAEGLADHLRGQNWPVSIRHRELDQRGTRSR